MKDQDTSLEPKHTTMSTSEVVVEVDPSPRRTLLQIRNELSRTNLRKEKYSWEAYRWYLENLKGAFAGWILVISFIFSYASIIFTSHPSLEPYLTVGINQILFSYCIGTTINAIFGDTYFGISGPNTTVALFLAIAGRNFDSGFPTYLVFASMLTILYGASMAITGWISVGKLFLSSKVAFPEYLHPCLVGGISLGAAWYFFQYGVVITTGINFEGYSDIDDAMTFHNFALTAPAVVIAAISLALKRTVPPDTVLLNISKGRNSWAVCAIFVPVPLFYMILYASGSDTENARAYGWLYKQYSYTPAWEIWEHWNLDKVSGTEIAKSLPTLVLADIVLVVEYLLVLQGMQLLVKESTDYDQDFRANGYACLVSGFAGGLGGHHAFAESVVIHQNGGSSRFAPAVTVVLNFIALMVGYSSVVSYIPRFVLAATIIDLGFLFISTWLYDKYFEFERYEWTLSVTIMFLVLIFGFGWGVCIGLMVCIIINSFARRTTVIGAVSYKEHVIIDSEEKTSEQLVNEPIVNDAMMVIDLQGHMFVRAGSKLFILLHNRLNEEPKLQFVILNFAKVQGFDSSSILTLSAFVNYCTSKKVVVLFFKVGAREGSFFYEKGINSQNPCFMRKRIADMLGDNKEMMVETVQDLKALVHKNSIQPEITEQQ